MIDAANGDEEVGGWDFHSSCPNVNSSDLTIRTFVYTHKDHNVLIPVRVYVYIYICIHINIDEYIMYVNTNIYIYIHTLGGPGSPMTAHWLWLLLRCR